MRTIGIARLLSGATAGALALFVASVGPAQVTEPAKDTAEEVLEKGSEKAQVAKERAEETRDRVKAAAKDAREKAKETADEAREKGREAVKNARDRVETLDDEDVEEARDRARDRAESARDRAREFARDARERFRWQDMRPADIGLWFDRSAKDKLVISDVEPKGAIGKLGFREGDVVISLNGHKVTRPLDVIEHLFADDAGNKRVEVIIERKGSNETIYVEPNALKDEYSTESHDPLEHFGIVLDDRDHDRIVVWKVLPRSPAFYAGIRAGDVITTFQDQPVAGSKEFVQAVQGINTGAVEVGVERKSRKRSLEVELPNLADRGERGERREVFRRGERREESREERREDRDERPGDVPRNKR